MASPKHSLAEIITDVWDKIIVDPIYSSHHLRHLNAIRLCRTPAMGGHLYKCDRCSSYHKRYNSCRNRHCPTCQQTQRSQWVQSRTDELLPVSYYHVVFTLPSALHELCLSYPRQLYGMLFNASWETLSSMGWDHKYLGAQIGAVMVLHTWGQSLSLHPHVHAMVPGGGVDYRARWRVAKGKGKYLFPVKAMSAVFRGKMVDKLKQWLSINGMEYTGELHDNLYKKDWVVYCKRPFGGSTGVIEYLARYTYKTAISNHRIVSKDATHVVIKYKDYRHGGVEKYMRLLKQEFVRRFSLHVLPKGFTRIRHYGILSGRLKKELFGQKMTQERSSVNWEDYWMKKGLDVGLCPNCKKGRLLYIRELPKRGPPVVKTSNKTPI